MGADYSFYMKTIETHARTFLALNILATGRVSGETMVNNCCKGPYFNYLSTIGYLVGQQNAITKSWVKLQIRVLSSNVIKIRRPLT